MTKLEYVEAIRAVEQEYKEKVAQIEQKYRDEYEAAEPEVQRSNVRDESWWKK